MSEIDELLIGLHDNCSPNCPHTVGEDPLWAKEPIKGIILKLIENTSTHEPSLRDYSDGWNECAKQLRRKIEAL